MASKVLNCPKCAKSLEVDDSMAGQNLQCPFCNETFMFQGKEESNADASSELKSDEKECPYCGETIKKMAIKCRFCKSDLLQSQSPKNNKSFDIAVESKKKNKPLMMISIIAVIALTTGIVVTIVVFNHFNKTKVPQAEALRQELIKDVVEEKKTDSNQVTSQKESESVATDSSPIDDAFYDKVMQEYQPVADKGENHVARQICYNVCRARNDYKIIYDYAPPLGDSFNTVKIYDDERTTFNDIKKKADSGNPFYQAVVGGCYAMGYGIENDERQMFVYYEKSASYGFIPGKFLYGLALLRGKNKEKRAEGLRLIREAADAGLGEAESKIGQILLMWESYPGLVKEDYESAKKYVLSAADKGDKDAMFDKRISISLTESKKSVTPERDFAIFGESKEKAIKLMPKDATVKQNEEDALCYKVSLENDAYYVQSYSFKDGVIKLTFRAYTYPTAEQAKEKLIIFMGNSPYKKIKENTWMLDDGKIQLTIILDGMTFSIMIMPSLGF